MKNSLFAISVGLLPFTTLSAADSTSQQPPVQSIPPALSTNEQSNLAATTALPEQEQLGFQEKIVESDGSVQQGNSGVIAVEADKNLDELLDPETLRIIQEEADRLKLGKDDVHSEPKTRKVDPDDLLPSERRDLEAEKEEKDQDERRARSLSRNVDPSSRDDTYRPGSRRPGDAFRGTPSRSLGQSGNGTSRSLGNFGN